MKSLILFSFLAAVGLSACSSSDGGPPKITKCGKKWQFLAVDRKAQEKTDLTTSSPNLPAGRYDATTSSLYYWDKEADIKIQLATTIDAKTGEASIGVTCLGGTGIDTKMDDLSVTVPFVSNMIVDANGKSIITTRSITVELGSLPGQPLLRKHSDEISKDAQGSIKDTYDGYANTTYSLFKVNNSSYETRAQLKTDAPNKGAQTGLTVGVAVSYVKDRPVPVDPDHL